MRFHECQNVNLKKDQNEIKQQRMKKNNWGENSRKRNRDITHGRTPAIVAVTAKAVAFIREGEK